MLMFRVKRDVTKRALNTICSSNYLRTRNFCGTAAVGVSSSIERDTDYAEKVGMTNKVNQHDIAIVGGGMVGLAFACALSSMPLTKQLSIAIIDSNPALSSRQCFNKNAIPDPRVSTVTPSTISFFKEVGAWEHVQQQRHAFFNQMQVWDYTGLGYTRYNARDVGKDCLGCVVENKVLANSLLLCLQNADFQKTIYSARLTSMAFPSQSSSAGNCAGQEYVKDNISGASPTKENEDKKCNNRFMKLDLSDSKSIYAKLVVGADGAKSHVREIAALKTTGWKYPQSAIICTVEHAMENHYAWQRFLPSGPIALLPIGNNFSNIVWTMRPEESAEHKSMNSDDFVKAVNHALDYGYGGHPQSNFLDGYIDKFSSLTGLGVESVKEPFQVPPRITNVVSERMAFPLSLMHAHDYASKRVVLVGDAAHTVHPLAGQGVNLGFGDASTLAKIIAEGLSVGTDIGELSLLKKYERDRKAANVTMMAILDGFQRAFSVDLGPINVLRAAAFHGAQYITPLKRNIISYAMGEQKWPLFS
ncbi:ubiquinone biosynthesis monooxygenase Coq6 protein [Dioscorea alata]|uniref:Ubiquinone biosynthesis monooxygenase Coq6 protein n=2 Tax=Dioscorea alata TaxID=55571 RepID=A0ACB7USH6_DIOAL|nr:ubiquinone biosynthesis monooxygenase Coq6 protein [Dioscorea alata]KAH7663678.1 ubiquinone biosynthesis monooxygenase Coq6 protein [Dioscorea alata]